MTGTVDTDALATSACWLGAFVIGSVPLGHLLHRSRLRRDLRRLERGRWRGAADVWALLGRGASDPANALPTWTEVLGAVLDTAKVIGLAAGTLAIVRAATPDHYATRDLGLLPLWEVAALWAGLAAAVGHLWSVWLGFRGGGQGQAPLVALAMWFAPTAFVVAVASYLVGRTSGRPGVPVVVSLVGFVGWAWAGWIWDLPRWWGLAWGPEMAIWVASLAGVVAARNLRPDGSVGLSPRP